MNLVLRSKGTLALCASLSLFVPSCGDDDESEDGGTGGMSSGGSRGGSTTGGSAKGGATTGGKSAGGNASGGVSTGGATGLGGMSSTDAGAAGSAGDAAGGFGGGAAGAAGTGGFSDGGLGGQVEGTGGDTGTVAGAGGGEGEGAGGVSGAGGDGVGGAGGEGPVLPCVTNPQGDTGTLVYDFDAPGSASDWDTTFNPSGSDTLGDSFTTRSAAQGHSCPGSLAFTASFSTYGTEEDATAFVDFTPAVNWTNRTRLHVWVKIPDPGTGSLAYLDGINVVLRSASYGVTSSFSVPAAVLSDFGWHELILDLTTGTPVTLAVVNQLRIQPFVHETAPGGAPAAPATTELYVDDIWVE